MTRIVCCSLIMMTHSLSLAAPPIAADPRVIVGRAIEAAGGQSRLESLPAGRAVTKGTMAAGTTFVQEAFHQLPDRMKETVRFEGPRAGSTITVALDGQNGWIAANGRSATLSDPMLRELREAANLLRAVRLTPLLTTSYQLKVLWSAQIDGQEVAGIVATAHSLRDLKLYFSLESGLLVKVERTARDPVSNQEFSEDRYYRKHKKANGISVAREIVVERNGKPYTRASVESVEYLPGLDVSVFRQP